ncbi:MAG: protein-L-isoaspartate O-methyltransferase family protein [Aestuariivirgaceae bacterium]
MPATFQVMKDHAMDFALARAKMIESQIRPNGVTDEGIIQAMAGLPREFFVPLSRQSLAYMDEDLEIGSNRQSPPRFLLEPMTLARLLQLLALEPDETVLDVACGTGYSTAVLAHLAKSVVALECDSELAGQAIENLASLGLANTRVFTGSLSAGYLAEGPFDAILVNGRIPVPPLELLAQLKDHGRLAVVMGENDVAQGALFTRNGALSVRYNFDAAAPRLPGFEPARPAFEF